MLKVVEIVSSLQGEGCYTGHPTTFIRLHGCNLKCRFCDTPQKSKGKKKMSIDTICNYAFKMRNHHVCITGGEPLLQADCMPLVYELLSREYKVSIETNGSLTIDSSYLRSYIYTMDIKCPSSGMDANNKYDNLENLQAKDEVKFVISNSEDYFFAKEVLLDYPTKANIIFSPVFNEDGTHNGKELAYWLNIDKLPKVRLGMQTHKLLGIY